MTLIHSLHALINIRAGRAAAYMATLYYLEIISLMFGLMFLYGKAVSLIAGVILTLFLTVHIMRLYLGSEPHRKLQLFVIDVHASFAAGFLFHAMAQAGPVEPSSLPVLVMRAGIMACELPLLLLLTGKAARSEFH